MKQILVIFLLILLSISFDKVQSASLKVNAKTKTKVNTVSKAEVKLESKAKTNLKMKVKNTFVSEMGEGFESGSNSESMMQFLNTIEKNNTKAGVPKKKANITIKILPQENPDVILEKEESLNMLKEGFLKISSPQLLNINRWPKLSFPDMSEHQIPTEENYFRVNEAFDPLRNVDSPPTVFHFWFRLSERNFYYSVSKPNISVLGNIPVKDITDAYALKEFHKDNKCLKVDDVNNRDWTLCAQTKLIRNEWVCKIRALKQLEAENACLKRLLADDAVIVEKRVTQPIILIPQASPMCNENFNYEQNGADWDCDCKDGREQSPIDLPLPEEAIRSPVKPIFDYNEVKFKQPLTAEDGSLRGEETLAIEIDNHALKIKHDNFGKLVTMDGSLYTAQEIVFHSPAEHTINGKEYDLEMQIIHFGQTSGDLAKQVILSFVFEKKPGYYNKFIDDIDFFTLPNPMTKKRDLENNLFIPKIFYSAQDNDAPIMKPFAFYTYQGSLTAPPCTEKTIMYVAANPIPLGSTALELFQEALRFPDLEAIPSGDIITSTKSLNNNRVIQPRNGRNVFYYDAKAEQCAENPKANKRKQGHYERIDSDLVKYFYVTGEKPSGMAGSFVVSKNEAIGKGLLVP